MKTRHIFTALIGAALCSVLSMSALAGDVTIKLATTKASGSFAVAGLERFKEKVEAATDGSVTVEVYPDGQLGGQNEVFEGLEMGTVEMSYIAAGASDSFYPGTTLLGALFTMRDEDHALKIFTSEKAASIYEEMTAQIGVRYLSFSIEGARNIWSKAPVEKLEDLKGLKMRVPEIPMFVNSFEALGVNPTPMAITDVYTALQTGVIDGLEYDMTGVVDFNFYDHCQYCYQTNHGVSILTFAVAENFWQGLTPEQQEAIQTAADEVSAELNEEYYVAKEESIKTLEEKGVTFVELTDEDRQTVNELVRPIVLENIKTAGTEEDLQALIDLQ